MPPDVGALVGSLQREVTRGSLRARNGLKHVAGINRTRVGTTPKDVVWSGGKAQLWRYRSDRIVHPTPVVIVYSIISRSYMFDLYPGHSFVERLRDEGFDVYLLDWGVADERDSGLRLEVYANERLPRAIRAAVRESGTEDAIVLGYCFGGTLALMGLGADPKLPVRGLIEMATPVDFSQFGLFSQLLGAGGRLKPEDLIDRTGNVPPEAARDIFRVLKPTSQLTAYVNLYQNLWNDQFMDGYQAMSQWTRDHVPFPGAAFRDSVDMLFRDNALVNRSCTVRNPARRHRAQCPLPAAGRDRRDGSHRPARGGGRDPRCRRLDRDRDGAAAVRARRADRRPASVGTDDATDPGLAAPPCTERLDEEE